MGERKSRHGVDGNLVLKAAAELVDAEGLDALNLGRLAGTLGIRTPSIYNHVAGMNGLRQGLAVMGVRSLRDALARAAIGIAGDGAILAIARAYRQFAKDHPGLYAASLRAPTEDEPELARASEETLAVLRAVLAPFALDGKAEIHALRAFRSLAHGFVSLELAGGFGLPIDLDESYRVLVGLLVAGLRRDRSAQEAK